MAARLTTKLRAARQCPARSRSDVSRRLRRLAGRGLPIAARSGGHGDAGFSTPNPGLVVDVSDLRRIAVKADGEVHTVDDDHWVAAYFGANRSRLTSDPDVRPGRRLLLRPVGFARLTGSSLAMIAFRAR